MIQILKTWFNKIKNTRKTYVYVYAIFDEKPILNPDGTIKNKNINPLYFTSNIVEAEQALNLLLFLKHLTHFKSWLFFSKHIETMKPGYNSDLWIEYKNLILQDIAYNDYYILKLKYSNSEIASLLRIFSKCNPLYMPFEHIGELVEYISSSTSKSGDITLPHEWSDALEYDFKLKNIVDKKYKEAEKEINKKISK